VFDVGPNLRRLERAILLYLIDNTPTLEEIKESSRKTMEATMEFAEEARPYMEAGLAEAWKNLGKAWGASYRTAAQTLYLARRGYQSTATDTSQTAQEEQTLTEWEPETSTPPLSDYAESSSTEFAKLEQPLSAKERETSTPSLSGYDESNSAKQKSIEDLAMEWSSRNREASGTTPQMFPREPTPATQTQFTPSTGDVKELKTEIWSNLAAEWADLNCEKPETSDGKPKLVSEMIRDASQDQAVDRPVDPVMPAAESIYKAPTTASPPSDSLKMAEEWANLNRDRSSEEQTQPTSFTESTSISTRAQEEVVSDSGDAVSEPPQEISARISLHSASPDFGVMYDQSMKDFVDECTNPPTKQNGAPAGKTMAELAREWASMNAESISTQDPPHQIQSTAFNSDIPATPNPPPTPSMPPPQKSMEDLAREWSSINRDQQP